MFHWNIFWWTLASGFIPFVDFSNRKPFLLGSSLLLLLLGCYFQLDANFFFTMPCINAICSHILFTVITALRQGLVNETSHRHREMPSWFGVSYVIGLVHAMTLRTNNMCFVLSISISLGGYYFSFMKGLFLFFQRMRRMRDLFLGGDVKLWFDERHLIDSSRPEDMLRLFFSFCGTLAILFSISVFMMLREYNQWDVPVPWVTFAYDVIVIKIGWFIFYYILRRYENFMPQHVNELELLVWRMMNEVKYAEEGGSELEVIREAQRLIEMQTGVLSSPVITVGRSVISYAFKLLYQFIAGLAVIKKIGLIN